MAWFILWFGFKSIDSSLKLVAHKSNQFHHGEKVLKQQIVCLQKKVRLT
jgi:hypothetical protein